METGGERKGQPWARGRDVPGGLGGLAPPVLSGPMSSPSWAGNRKGRAGCESEAPECVPCGSLTGRIGIKKHTSTGRSPEDRLWIAEL